ncbi:tyrosine-type recombinase/integrase [Gordonia sp. 852002-50395_SCH5434458]|uniref:tyrosine-type recombinase/integrase n=1 Tax=Gordonia sp. 852002-50395_SCH5434458 TaxID=1834090 RepID=UPI0022B24B76|nr:tyrosine-type recombinase/integrase [Gordonia sp. 852002-50395_SCH5434458]
MNRCAATYFKVRQSPPGCQHGPGGLKTWSGPFWAWVRQFRGSNVNRALATACEAAGVDNVTTHAMRHAWASHAVDYTRVANLLGHADSTLVSRVYAHAGGDDELFAAVAQIEASTQDHTQSTHDASTSAVTDGQSATDQTP